MGFPYAEVIGDPVEHSKSPVIHRFWLDKLQLKGDYQAQRLTASELGAFLRSRCADPFWRGCNVTAPLKEAAAGLASDPTGICGRIGATNTIFRSPLGCGVGANTDLIGAAEAIGARAGEGKICLIGAGGAARPVLQLLSGEEVVVIARNLAKAEAVAKRFGAAFCAFEDAGYAIEGATCVINATPLGMAGMEPMPPRMIAALAATDHRAIVFDMVYAPLETPFLAEARRLGRPTADGLTMLIGQAAPAFEIFFGAPAPREHDAELRELLTR